jgi:hypothetical protein
MKMKPHLTYMTRYRWWVLYFPKDAPMWFSSHSSLTVLWREWQNYVKTLNLKL